MGASVVSSLRCVLYYILRSLHSFTLAALIRYQYNYGRANTVWHFPQNRLPDLVRFCKCMYIMYHEWPLRRVARHQYMLPTPSFLFHLFYLFYPFITRSLSLPFSLSHPSTRCPLLTMVCVTLLAFFNSNSNTQGNLGKTRVD